MSIYDASKIISLDPSERQIKRLFWRDDMENYATIKWLPSVEGPDTVPTYINTVQAFEGDYVLSLANAVTVFPSVFVRFERLRAQRVGLEARWWKDDNLVEIAFDIMNYGYFASFHWHRDSNIWRFLNLTTQVDVPRGTEIIGNDLWCYFYMVVNLEKGIYSRLKTNYLDLDLEHLNLPIRTLVSPVNQSEIRLFAETEDIGDPVYFDDVRFYHEV